MIRSDRKDPHVVKEAAVRGKQIAITAAVALAVVVAYEQYRLKKA